MDIFCQKHSNCEESISVITDILADNDPLKFEEISNEFELLGFNKVKDLAKTTLGNASKMALGGDPLAKLYQAIQVYDQQCADQLISAKSEYQKGNFERTIEKCNSMLSFHPTDFDVLILLAASYYNNQQYDDSIECLERAFHLKRNHFALLNNLGANYWKKSQPHNAVKHFAIAILLKNKNIDGWINYAEALVKINENKTADKAYQIVLGYKPECSTIHNKYGKLLLSLNEVNKAKEEFEIARQCSSKCVDTLNNLGEVYFITGENDKSVFYYEKALEINPSLTISWINLGRVYLKLKENEKAINSFQCALQICPENYSALRNLAQAYFIKKNEVLALKTYKQLLELYPDDSDINFEVGKIHYHCQKNNKESTKYFKKCLELNPENEDYYLYLSGCYLKNQMVKQASDIYLSLGDLYFDRNEPEKARNAYINALFTNSENAYLHWKLGLALYKLGHFDLALTRYRKSIEMRPNFANVYCDCALVYEALNLPEKAIEYYNMVLLIQPDHFNGLHNLILLKTKLCDYDDVVKLYQKMLELKDSDTFDIHIELANIFYKIMGNLKQALYHYDKALEFDHTYVDAHLNMGEIFLKLKLNKDALRSYFKAVQIENCVIAYINIACIFKNMGDFSDALSVFNHVLSIEPDHPELYCNLVPCLQQVCNWSEYDLHITKLKGIICEQLENDDVLSLLPHDCLLYPFSPELLKKIATKYAEQCVKKSQITSKSPSDYVYQMSLTSNEHIRVGYVSSDFGEHSTLQIMQSVPKFHDRNKIEVYFFSLSPFNGSPSWSTKADHLIEISNQSVVDIANKINEIGIHILVNMDSSSLDASYGIFALRPAPIQVQWPGYPMTSGATFMDYIITDKVCSPSEHEHFYSEKLAYLNQSVFICNHKKSNEDIRLRVPSKRTKSTNKSNNFAMSMNNGSLHIENNPSNELASGNTTISMYSVKMFADSSLKCYTRQMYSLPEDVVVYCNFNKLCKIVPSTLNMWTNILKNVPGSVLWLLCSPNKIGEENVRAYAAEQDIDSSRIIFSPLEPNGEHMSQIQLADVFLDTPLYNGHTTCLDALWSGTPIVTMLGETFATRMTASQLTTLGCADMIAVNEEEYIKIAVSLGTDMKHLDDTRSKIWDLKIVSKLFDCESYVKELEIVYNVMWNNYNQTTN